VGFGSLTGLYALLVLVPFIILYLRRPKSVEKVIPSLMFLLQEKRQAQKYSFLRKLLRNLLFILQMVGLSAMALTIASPFITLPYTGVTGHTVIVLDVSASMQANDGISTRFEKAVSEAENRLSGTTSLILAENTPLVVLEKGSRNDAQDILNSLKPRATRSNVGDAMLLAKDLIGGAEGRVVVISDFKVTEGADITVAKRTLEMDSIPVELIQVGGPAKNVGIVNLEVDKKRTKIEIRNYNDEEVSVPVKVVNNGKEVDSKRITLLPLSVESQEFATPPGITTVELDIRDDLTVDDKVYLNVPSSQVRVVLLTNRDSDNFIRAALEASPGVTVETRKPPATNAENIDHDVIVVNYLDKERLLPHEFDYVGDKVQKGAHLIVMAQDDLASLEVNDLLPVILDGKGDTAEVCSQVENEVTKHFRSSCFTRSPYLKASAKNGSLVVASAGDSPVIAIGTYGQGKVVYYGIYDDQSSFKTDSDYPIFWDTLLKSLTQREEVRDFNFRTGTIMPISQQQVKTPTTVLNTGRLILDEAGFYEIGGKKLAVNLADEKESDIRPVDLETGLGEVEEKKTVAFYDFGLEIPLLILSVIVLGIEFIYIKRRGDV